MQQNRDSLGDLDTEHPELQIQIEGIAGLTINFSLSFCWSYTYDAHLKNRPADYTVAEIIAIVVRLLLAGAVAKCDELKQKFVKQPRN